MFFLIGFLGGLVIHAIIIPIIVQRMEYKRLKNEILKSLKK